MKSLLVFIPARFKREKPGYLYGTVTYDSKTEVQKFYILAISRNPPRSLSITNLPDSPLSLIGHFSGRDVFNDLTHKRVSNYINISLHISDTLSTNFNIDNVTSNGKKFAPCPVVLTVYDETALLDAELFRNKSSSGDDFYELREMLQTASIEPEINGKWQIQRTVEILLAYHMLLYLYPIIAFSKVTNKLLPVLRYSTLGLHLNTWLENAKWSLITITENKRFSLKTGNYIVATLLDGILGIMLLNLIMNSINKISPSEILLSNAETLVEYLKNLINWLMDTPAGLKLNDSLNKMLGKFFLYNIQLWWIFLTFMKPIMNFAFNILVLFGRLGVTFQIAIASDLLALVSFHAYCIYVYAARLFNIQLQGLTALFRLFLGKKKNPLRERVDSCQYQPNQLFVGTLLFTILLFLMPTTWAYYTVFTSLRLLLISLSGFLSRLSFYLQNIPLYAVIKWLSGCHSTNSSICIKLDSIHSEGLITLSMTTAASTWKETWKHCIPDTTNYYPSIEWGTIIHNVLWGKLMYPL